MLTEILKVKILPHYILVSFAILLSTFNVQTPLCRPVFVLTPAFNRNKPEIAFSNGNHDGRPLRLQRGSVWHKYQSEEPQGPKDQFPSSDLDINGRFYIRVHLINDDATAVYCCTYHAALWKPFFSKPSPGFLKVHEHLQVVPSTWWNKPRLVKYLVIVLP